MAGRYPISGDLFDSAGKLFFCAGETGSDRTIENASGSGCEIQNCMAIFQTVAGQHSM